QTCVNGKYGSCTGAIGPTAETCNDVDDDCDGVIDNGCICRRGDTRGCYAGPAGTGGVGICRVGTQSCVIQGGVASWGACSGQVLPGQESCNALDDDCNGKVDDGLSRSCGNNVGACRPGTQVCAAGARGACTGGVDPEPELCNGIDDDCDGVGDDGFQTPVQTLSPRAPTRDVDILFMIDDSASMDLNQASLIANFPILMQVLRGFPGGLPNLHLGVVTSSLGAGPFPNVPSCPVGGAGGAFHAPPVTAQCLGPHDPYMIASNGEATKNYDGTIE